ncbi:LysR family transcriptional regulator [Mucilaginibacter terrenus]|uniref:LysR family transcriptional regulator n=1 Tax=Mucilaginibacter terrenus TaxID=2482727 RepID=A0A3E2NWB3_9SPHI|nr:LysR family transcriptional regulator [Mucilaginibacter terrenus]RFZ85306.1 LysR family transcriptional regulator [Mucilaginibacter terrenus]
MKYTLHQLQVFSKVVQAQSITKAAEELFLTQPGVSIQLKNFQDQFDIPLTEVIGRQLYVTDFGKEIAELAQQILNQVEEIDYRTSAFKGRLYGRLKMAVVSTGKYVMPYFLSAFINENPSIELTMDVTNRAAVIKALENNEADFGLVSVLPDKLKIEEELLLENKLFLVGDAESKLEVPAKNIQLLEQLPMIYREEGSATRMVMEKFLEKKKIHLKKRLELTSNEAVKQAVIAGLGYSVMPLIGIRNEVQDGDLKIIPVADFPIRSRWRLIWLKNKKLPPVASAYLEHVRQHKAAIIEKHFSWIETV